jgi:hypothetical protein
MMSKLFGCFFALLLFMTIAVPATAQTCTPAPSGMVSWYRMEGSPNDELGNNNPSATSAISFVGGEVGQGVTFGAGGFIQASRAATQPFGRVRLKRRARGPMWVVCGNARRKGVDTSREPSPGLLVVPACFVGFRLLSRPVAEIAL